ncbi:hypothetical protein MJ561_00565 [Klebsiella pneumoniae]|nr:hypothetical protein MJ561_00565 [Klebsiella pneumoniae]
MVWRSCSCVFDYCTTTRHPFVPRLEVHHSGSDQEAPGPESGTAVRAWRYLMQEKARLESPAAGVAERFPTTSSPDGQPRCR